LVPVRTGDVVIAFAFRREQAGLGAVLGHARAVGARSLLIADTVVHTLKTSADLSLAAPRGQDEEFLTLTVPMLIANALVLTLAGIDQGRSIAGLQTLDHLYEAVSSNR
jgi:DNA-binding MurR/RpiR family transcriptional regulator